MRIKSYILVATALFILLINSISYAANQSQSNQFGYVNIAETMLLHPTMRYFDPIAKRFKLEALKGVDPEKRSEENKVNFRADLSKLEDNLKGLEAQRIQLEEDYNNQLESMGLSNQKIKNISESEKNKYNEKRSKIDNKYHKDADDLRKKIYYAKQKIETFKKSSIYTNLTTQGETSQLFSLMLDDVYDAVGAVAKHYNINFVFNSSAEITYIEGRINSPNPLNEFFENFEEKESSKDGKKITGAAITSWLGETNSSFLNCNDQRLKSFVIMGGLNMTPAVIDYIYQKHKIGKSQRNFIIEYFEKIVNNNKKN